MQKKRSAAFEWRSQHFIRVAVSICGLSLLIAVIFISFQRNREVIRGFLEPVELARLFDLQIVDVDFRITGEKESQFQFQSQFLESFKKSLLGRPIWSVSLEQVQRQFSDRPWLVAKKVRKLYPNRVELEIEEKEAVIVVRGRNSWVLAGQEGSFLFASNAFLGDWASLPVLAGFEDRVHNEPKELNRLLSAEKEVVRKVVAWQKGLYELLGFRVIEASVHYLPWQNEKAVSFVMENGLRLKAFVENRNQQLLDLQLVLSEEVIDNKLPDEIDFWMAGQVIVRHSNERPS